VLEQITKETV